MHGSLTFVERIFMNNKQTKLGSKLTSFTIVCGQFIGCHKVLYYILNFTWGILGVILGALIWLILFPWRLPCKDKTYLGAVKTHLGIHSLTIKSNKKNRTKEAKYYWGFSVGIFYFVSQGASDLEQLNAHEVGHTCQNALFGPFQIFVLLASVIRFWVRHIMEACGKMPKTSYYDIWFENSASYIGESLAAINKLEKTKKK